MIAELIRVERFYLVNLATGEVWVEKTSKRDRNYLSTITSARKIRRLTKLAQAIEADAAAAKEEEIT